MSVSAADSVWELVAQVSDFEGSDRVSIIVDDTPALLIRQAGTYYAIEDVCSHDGQPLTDGEIVSGSIECPRHGARFEIASGRVLCMPATESIRVFEVSLRESSLYARPVAAGVVPEPPAVTSTEDASASATDSSAASGLPQVQTSCSSSPEQAAECEHHGETTTGSVAESTAAPAAEESRSANLAAGNPFLQPPGEGAMLDALKQVIDPELFVNIVDLGLVYDITLTGHDAVVTMTLTSPSCPAGPQLVSQARSALEKMPGVHSAEIKLTMSPPWTPEMMTEDARDQLGIF